MNGFIANLRAPLFLLAMCGTIGCATQPEAPKVADPKTYREPLPSSGKVVDISVRNHHVLVYAYGGELYREKPGVVRGKGVSLLLADNLGRVATRLDWPASSDGDVVIDSTGANAGVVKITTFGADASAEAGGQSPLVETTLTSRLDGSTDFSRRILIAGEDLDVATLTRMCKLAVATSAGNEDFWRIVHRIRNYGARQPDLAVEALRAIQDRVNGMIAERIGGCIEEINQFREVRSLAPNAVAMR